jgi:MerR family transcriptional regulator, copper efflux regulator
VADPQMHQIGEAASRAGLSFRTVRYYEEVGLVVPSGRTEGGFRLYTDADIERLALVKQLKPLDFSLDDLRELLEARDRLAEDDLAAEERAALGARLGAFVDQATERCQTLRRELEQVEAVTATLVKEAKAVRRKVTAARRG